MHHTVHQSPPPMHLAGQMHMHVHVHVHVHVHTLVPSEISCALKFLGSERDGWK